MSRRVVVPVEPTEAMSHRGGYLLSEWFNDNAPIGQKYYEPQANRLFTELLAAAPPYEPSEAEVEAATIEGHRYEVIKDEQCIDFDPAGSTYQIEWRVFDGKELKEIARFDDPVSASRLAGTMNARAALIAADKARLEGK